MPAVVRVVLDERNAEAAATPGSLDDRDGFVRECPVP
jgi:hypothetical protein